MSEQIRISAKNLGEVALGDFCPRCFWIKLRLRHKLPFQIFPGIFSSLDSYNKRIFHSWFDRHGCPPACLKDLGDLTGYKVPPHFSKFSIVDEEQDILLTGNPDGVFIRPDNSHIIVDYKTAKYTGNQDRLLPMYEAQLNAYGLIGERKGLAPISGLALIYMEPITDDSAAANDENHSENGFVMGFSANIHVVCLNPSIIPPLLAKTRQIYGLESSPTGRDGCEDCKRLTQLLPLIQ